MEMARSSQPPPENELEGWKQIADYLGRSPRGVQNWANQKGLPVHKLGGRVIAYRSELNEWRKAQVNLNSNEVGLVGSGSNGESGATLRPDSWGGKTATSPDFPPSDVGGQSVSLTGPRTPGPGRPSPVPSASSQSKALVISAVDGIGRVGSWRLVALSRRPAAQ